MTTRKLTVYANLQITKGRMIIFRNLGISLIVLLLFVLISSASADDNQLKAERPKDESFRTILKNEPSTLNIPIEVTSAELSKLLNQSVRKELYKGSTRTRGVIADVLRNGAIVVNAADNYLFVTIPVTMTLSYAMYELKPVPLKLKFKVAATVTPEWRLQTQIYYLGVSDLLSEKVGVGLLSFSPRSIVDGLTEPLQKMISGLISQKINEVIHLKSEVEKVWGAAQKPIFIDKKYHAWLKLTPQEVMLYPLYTENNKVRLSIGIKTFAEMVVGSEPATAPPLPLPKLKLLNTFDKTFRITLNTTLPYKDIRAIAEPFLLNKSFDSDGKSVTIRDFELYGNGDKLIVKLQTEGSLEGVFYLNARPVFNPETNIFSVEDVDFEMQTQSLLLRSANWFLHGTIRGMIQEKLNMNLTKQIEESRQLAGKALAHIKLKENVFLRCDIKKLKFSDAIVQKDKILIQINAEGESMVFYDKR